MTDIQGFSPQSFPNLDESISIPDSTFDDYLRDISLVCFTKLKGKKIVDVRLSESGKIVLETEEAERFTVTADDGFPFLDRIRHDSPEV